MADVVVTVADVLAERGSDVLLATAGVDIVAGEVLYMDRSEGTAKLARADDAAKAQAIGIALCSAAERQPVAYLGAGLIELGATLSVGTVYAVSLNGGNIAPVSDVEATRYVTVLGIATTAAVLRLDIQATGVVKA